MWEVNCSVDFTICKSPIRGKKYCIAPGAGNKSDVLTYEIAPHSGEFASFRRQAWSNAPLFPGYSPACGGAFRWLVHTENQYRPSLGPLSSTMQVEARKISQMLKDMPERNLCAHRVTLLGQGWENVALWPSPDFIRDFGGRGGGGGGGGFFPYFLVQDCSH